MNQINSDRLISTKFPLESAYKCEYLQSSLKKYCQMACEELVLSYYRSPMSTELVKKTM